MAFSESGFSCGIKYTGPPSALASSVPLTPMKDVCNVGRGLSNSRGIGKNTTISIFRSVYYRHALSLGIFFPASGH